MPHPAQERYLTMGEAAARLGLSRHTLRRVVTRGALAPALRTPGGYNRFRVADVVAYGQHLRAAAPRMETDEGEVAGDGRAPEERADRGGAMRAATQRLEQERAHFLSAILHDLKTPLTSVRGYTQMAQRQAARLDPAHTDLPRYLGQIDQGTTRLLTLIDELTDATRARLGQELELHRLPADVVALARGVVAQHAGLTAQHVTVAASPPALDATVDAARLERVLGNLLANALKYSPADGDIEVRVTQEGDAAVIAVRDQGLGVPAADLPHVFAPFQRGSNVGRIEGTGMGLAGARHIVEAHGGTLTVESMEGVGSTFTVRLPIDAPEDPEHEDL